MKKRIKNAGEYRRFYASGIPMQREQKNLFPVVAGTMVNIVLVKTHTAICEVKCSKEQKAELGRDSVVISVPLDNFAGDKIAKVKPEKAAKPAKAVKKAKKAVAIDTQAAVAAEPVNDTIPAVEVHPDTAPVNPEAVQATIETPVDAPVVNTEATPVEQPAEMAVI